MIVKLIYKHIEMYINIYRHCKVHAEILLLLNLYNVCCVVSEQYNSSVLMCFNEDLNDNSAGEYIRLNK